MVSLPFIVVIFFSNGEPTVDDELPCVGEEGRVFDFEPMQIILINSKRI
jgi:hypothetical protein